MTYTDFITKTGKLSTDIAMIKGAIEEKHTRIKKLQEQEQASKDRVTLLQQCVVLLDAASQQARDGIKQHFEKIITDALQFATQSTDYSFVIDEMKNRQKTSYEFYVKCTVNGVESLQKPEDANGGGFVDIISLVMKYAYLQLFDDPKIMSGTLLYDEPGKMISADMSVKFAEYVKFLGSQYNRQTIMITHNDRLASVADKTFTIAKNSNGISDVTDNSTINDNIIREFKTKLEDLYE